MNITTELSVGDECIFIKDSGLHRAKVICIKTITDQGFITKVLYTVRQERQTNHGLEFSLVEVEENKIARNKTELFQKL